MSKANPTDTIIRLEGVPIDMPITAEFLENPSKDSQKASGSTCFALDLGGSSYAHSEGYRGKTGRQAH